MKKTSGNGGKKVGFEFVAMPGSEVFVAGTFNDWNPMQHRMRDNPNGGVYRMTLALPPGRHEYKFVVNGEWCADPKGSESAPDGHGSVNSVISV